MPGPVVIRFFAPVIEASVNALLQTVDNQLRRGVTEFILLLSSPGGSVFHGLSAYNYLKGIPARVTTHNFGSVDSVGVALFCGGGWRMSVPQARFTLHPPTANFQNVSLDEAQIVEQLARLRLDSENMARIIAANSNRTLEQVLAAMHERRTLNADEAVSWGLVDTIQTQLYPAGSLVISIQAETQPAPKPAPAQPTPVSTPDMPSHPPMAGATAPQV